MYLPEIYYQPANAWETVWQRLINKMENNFNKENVIQGYLECNGEIVRVSSLEDIRNFALKYGKRITERTETELDELTDVKSKICKKGIKELDDCNVSYIQNPLILFDAHVRIENYKIREGTIAVSDGAFSDGPFSNEKNAPNAIRIPNSVICIGKKAFYYLRGLKCVILSNSLVKIGEGAFAYCSNISDIDLPNTLKYIGAEAFEATAIEKLVLPANLETIGSHAFKDCKKLRIVVFNGVPRQINSGVFDGCESLERIEIPQGHTKDFIEKLFPLSPTLIEEPELPLF